MPVADTIHELSHHVSHLQLKDEADRIEPSQVPRAEACINSLRNIVKLREEIEMYQKEEAEAKKSADQVAVALKEAQEILTKAEEKKKALVEKNLFLEKKLQDQERRVEQAVCYWRNYGLDVKEISKPEDSYDEYEFTFTNLQRKSKKTLSSATAPPTAPTQPDGDNNSTPTGAHIQTTCSFRLRYQDKKLEIVDQAPQILSTEEVSQLNDKITQHCVNQERGTVNYKSAMVLVRQDLKRTLFPSPKTCSHPPAETNSHTCT